MNNEPENINPNDMTNFDNARRVAEQMKKNATAEPPPRKVSDTSDASKKDKDKKKDGGASAI